jgi:hypothetical protein
MTENTTLLAFLVTLITFASGWAIIKGSALLNAKAEEIKQTINNRKLSSYIDIAVKTVTDVVKALNQSVVDDLKEMSEDGKLTADEKQRIFDNALSTIQHTLSEDMITTLSTVYGDLDEWLKTQIDTAVSKEKDRKLNQILNSKVLISTIDDDIDEDDDETQAQPKEGVITPKEDKNESELETTGVIESTNEIKEEKEI